MITVAPDIPEVVLLEFVTRPVTLPVELDGGYDWYESAIATSGITAAVMNMISSAHM